MVGSTGTGTVIPMVEPELAEALAEALVEVFAEELAELLALLSVVEEADPEASAVPTVCFGFAVPPACAPEVPPPFWPCWPGLPR